MKKIITSLSLLILLVLLLSSECRKSKYKTNYNETALYGTWSASINNWCDTNSACNKVSIEFDPSNIAYLNYNGPKGNLWSSSYKCKWWIDYTNVPYPHYWDNTDYQSYLYILRFDTLGLTCKPKHCSCVFPDTNIYVITNLNSNTLNVNLLRMGLCGYDYDMFFCTRTGGSILNFLPFTQTLYK